MTLNRYCIFMLFFVALFFRNATCEDHVIELTDANFEELTQISSGHTTGAWFIKFYAPWCTHCKAMSKTWNELAKELKNQINIAKIDVTVNSRTRKRFKIEGFPTLLFFKNGKMYDYKHNDRSLEGFKRFVLDNYKHFKSTDPPKPLSNFDLIKDFVTETIGNIARIYKYAFPSLAAISLIAFFVGTMFGVLVMKCCRRSTPVTPKPKVSNKNE